MFIISQFAILFDKTIILINIVVIVISGILPYQSEC